MIKVNAKTKRKVKTISYVISTALLIITMVSASLAGFNAAAGVTASSIQQLRAEKAEYARQKEEVNARIDAIEFERMTQLEKKAVLDERIVLTGMEISNLKETINQYNLLISEKEYEIIIAQNREEEQLQRYKARVRDMEENGFIPLFELLLTSSSFMDFLAGIDFINIILEADKKSYEALQDARAATETAVTELEEIEAGLSNEFDALRLLEEELNVQLNEAHALILEIEANLGMQQDLLSEIIEEEDRVQRQIKAAEEELARQRRAAQQAALAAQNQSGQGSTQGQSQGSAQDGSSQAAGTGELMWPASGSVISNYGMRNGRMHQGIDIGAPHGVPVVAADGGTVTTSTHGPGYGHYIIISHGNGMTTLYAHLSSRAVSVGDSVSKGQQIGQIGSTGNASTPHLHFEVSVNGSRVNPITKL